jgi:hypothetical protein
VVVWVLHLVVGVLGFLMWRFTWVVVLAILIGLFLWQRRKREEPGE